MVCWREDAHSSEAYFLSLGGEGQKKREVLDNGPVSSIRWILELFEALWKATLQKLPRDSVEHEGFSQHWNTILNWTWTEMNSFRAEKVPELMIIFGDNDLKKDKNQ